MLPRKSTCLVLMLFALVGCAQEETIREYRFAVPDREPIRLLAAIFDVGEGAKCFVRMSGPPKALEAQEALFVAFIDTLEFDGKKEPPLTYKAPPTWIERPAGKMVLKDFFIPGNDKLPDLKATISLAGGSELANVNRWRKQLQLGDLSIGELPNVLARKTKNGREICLVDMTGLGVFEPVAPPRVRGESELPFRMTPPATWKRTAPVALSQATFEVVEGNQKAIVSFSRLGGDGGGLKPNVDRWRGQIGLAPSTEAELQKSLSDLEITKLKVSARLVDLANPATDKRIVVAMFSHDDATWFVKMSGPNEFTGRAKASLEEVVKNLDSVR